MHILHADLPPALALLGWAVTLAALAHALWRLRRQRQPFLPDGAAQHGWLAAIVAVTMLWSLHVRSPLGLDFGLLGSALFALVYGRARATLGLLAAAVLATALHGGAWLNLGVVGVALAVVPAWLASALQGQIERRLPRQLFVFIIGNGLFVTLLATAASSALLLSLSAVELPAAVPVGDHYAYALLLAWGEALLTGMLFSALVVFAPRAVLTYRQELYLPARRRPS
jgi:uncharacterized membrane protein